MKISEQKGKIPTRDRSFDDRRRRRTLVEVATSFSARLLGAIGELKKFLNSQTKKKEEEKVCSALKIQREVVPSLSARSGFYRLMIA